MKSKFALWSVLFFSLQAKAFFGTEMGPLIQLVAGQLQEIEKLSRQVGLAENQIQYLTALNDGIDKTVHQIQSVQSIYERAQGLDPREIKSLSDLSSYLDRARETKIAVEELLALKVGLAGQAVESSALQADTSYRMGQEMVTVGAALAQESQQASPGRAAQISAAASSAQMLSSGVELQTLSQLVQLQAMNLELQRSLIDRDLQADKTRQKQFQQSLLKNSSVLAKSPKRRAL